VLLRMRQLGTLGNEPASLAAFNHAILYVPKYQMFLDGTADFHGAREVPGADRDANALIVEPGGKSEFLTTPEAKPEDNATREQMEIALKADGSARLVGQSTVGGEGAAEYRREFQAVATRKSTFEQRWGRSFPGVSAVKVEFGDLTQLERDVTVNYELQIPRYSEVLATGIRFFPFGNPRTFTETYAPLEERQFDLVLPSPGMIHSVYKYSFPNGFAPTGVPTDVSEVTPFGRYTLSHRVDNGTLYFELEVALTVSRVSVKDYPAFRAFVGRMDQAFSRKVVATGSTGPTAAR
jgi:hypothetical protein